MSDDTGRAGFLESCDVSRETLDRLDRYAALLKKWNGAINLVSASTVGDLWTRHFLDSAEVFAAAPDQPGAWLDLGSGAGFPGLVAAILARGQGWATSFTFVEADLRKATFLKTVSRETSTPIHVLSRRVEDVPPQGATVISARALAGLPRLLAFAEKHLSPGGVCLFPKGANHKAEVDEALADWRFSLDVVPSATGADSVILRVGDLRRA